MFPHFKTKNKKKNLLFKKLFEPFSFTFSYIKNPSYQPITTQNQHVYFNFF